MNLNEMENGAHFWGLVDAELVLIGKFENDFFVCGGWEGSIKESDITFIEEVNLPSGFTIENLYYI